MTRPALRVRIYGAALALLAGGIVQADSADEIARCARISSLAERVICLEDALRRTDVAVADSPVEMPANPSSATRPPPATGLPEAPESIRVTVTTIEKSPYGKLRFVIGDGQVWQQIDQRTPRFPDVPFAAEIRTAAAGSFFLQPLDGGVAVRVRRRQ